MGVNMSNWEDFEKECCEYLNATYGNDNIVFKHQGASDSNAPDIKVSNNGIDQFNIEVKMASSQSGQFVVLMEGDKFVFSSANKSDVNDAKLFIEEMNLNFEKYKNVAKGAIAIDMSKDTYAKWIIKHYKNKGVEYIMSKSKDEYVIFPVEKYSEYFELECTYRVKKSGSRNVAKKYKDSLVEYFAENKVKYDGKYLVVETNNIYKHKSKFDCNGVTFCFSDKTDDGYKITIPGKTENPNIIFSIKLLRKQDEKDLKLFKGSLD